ncbi:MAG TPA: tetratricopeptide repeat protein, partial [Candidatus Acidoferrales bacterium]|nr:tetratricopeptide repeat protein [Candidatus Acidoferrales bacterium]
QGSRRGPATDDSDRVSNAAEYWMKMMRVMMAGLLCAAGWLAGTAQAQAPGKPAAPGTTAPGQAPRPIAQAAPTPTVSVDGREAMFTTMCALLASGFEANVSAEDWKPLRAQLRERMQHQEGPAVEAMRQYYKQHQLADASQTLSQYLWFGLVSGPAPKFEPVLRRDELPPEVIALEGFSELLANYYQEQKIGQLWRQVQPVYTREIERLHEAVTQIVFVASGYTRQIIEPASVRTFTIVVEPLVGRITNVRNYGDHYAIVLSGADEIPTDVVRHAFLHFLLDGLPLAYPHVVATKRPLFEKAALAPRLAPDLRDDFPSFVAECTVRAVELRLKKLSPGERDAALDADDADGYILVRPLFGALPKFEQSEPSMQLYFPDLLRAIDLAAESKRLETVKFAAAESASTASDPTKLEDLARRQKLRPTTVPNDPEAIAALTEAERRIAEKNPRAAEVLFQKVLAKYPEQARAWYGLGVVAMMEQDGARAMQIFERLTSGAHAATDDPLVLTWSHVYLGRIYGNEEQPEQAKAEYQAALAVEGGPEQARQAAQKGLAGLSASGKGKPAERP